MTTQEERDLEAIWVKIREAGSREGYIEKQLRERGLWVERRETEHMSKRELGEYKKSLKAEAATRRELLKETWEAYHENHIVHLGQGVFWNEESDWDKYDHPRAEERVAENELPPLDKPLQLAEALEVTIAQLRWLTFHREAATSLHYQRFTIPKRDGSERAIWAPRPLLKQSQRWILHEIVERLPIHGAAHGFVPGRSIYTNATQHTNSSVILKMDLKDFFPTVTYPRVRGVFRKAGYREQVSTLLALLCTEAPREIVELEGQTYYAALGPRCLPQGAPTSPALTNTICLRMDRRLAGLANKYGWRYTRYADDLTFSLPDDGSSSETIAQIIGGVHAIVDDEGFVVHPDKTRVLRKGSCQRVTGLVVNGEGSPRVPRALRRQLRAVLHNLGQGKEIREDESFEMLMGYAAFVYMTDRELGARLLADLGEFAPQEESAPQAAE